VGEKVYDELAKAGTRNVVGLYEPVYPGRRRAAAVLSILWDALFLAGREATVEKNPEHFELDYGAFAGPATELAPLVWAREGTHGFVVGNFSTAPFSYTAPVEGRTFTIESNDALAVQWADLDTGEPLASWITNEGR
jgi:hypothetical protein